MSFTMPECSIRLILAMLCDVHALLQAMQCLRVCLSRTSVTQQLRWCPCAGAAICQHRGKDLCGHKDRHISWKREEELLVVVLCLVWISMVAHLLRMWCLSRGFC